MRRPSWGPDAPALFAGGARPPKRPRSAKNRVRALQRLLNRAKNPALPRAAAHDKRRLLRRLEGSAAVRGTEARERRYGLRYHRVKFFERRKAERRRKAAAREAARLLSEAAALKAATGSDSPALLELRSAHATADATAAAAEDDCNYVKWFPRHIKYVSLYAADKASEDAALTQRREALRRWARANASARAFVPTPPAEDAAVDFGEVDDGEDDEEGVETAGADNGEGDGVGNGEPQAVATASAMAPVPLSAPTASRKRLRVLPALSLLPLSSSPAAAPFRLPSRLVAARPGVRAIGTAAAGADEGEDFESEAALTGSSRRQRSDLTTDPFFGGANGEQPVFVEEAGEDGGAPDGSDGNWRSGPDFNGRRTAAARFERERLGADHRRYRDSAATPVSAPAPAHRMEGAVAASTAEATAAAAARLAGLAGRKRKRAERALRFEQGRGGAGGAPLLGVHGLGASAAARYTESFFGTARDEGARLKHRERLDTADRRAARARGRGSAEPRPRVVEPAPAQPAQEDVDAIPRPRSHMRFV